MGNIEVKNIKSFITNKTLNLYSDLNTERVYIGRFNKYYGLLRSLLYNPFKISKELDRKQCCIKYKEYIIKKIKSDTRFQSEIIRLLNILQYKDIELICWCHPEECHGNIIKNILDLYKK